MKRIVVATGGAASCEEDSDGPEAACRAAMKALKIGQSALVAAIQGCQVMEDDERFNAGTGSNDRNGLGTAEMDAACMTSDGKFGAVACLRHVKNPILVAQAVHATPHNLLAGSGAMAFARALGHPVYEAPLGTHHEWPLFSAKPDAPLVPRHLVGKVPPVAATASSASWSASPGGLQGTHSRQGGSSERSEPPSTLGAAAVPARRLPGPRAEPVGSDTVCVVVFDGMSYAAAASSGGPEGMPHGRVGDVPMIGCGIYATPSGAVAVTGLGEAIMRHLMSRRLSLMMDAGHSPANAADHGLSLVAPSHLGIVAIHGEEHVNVSSRPTATATLVE